MASRAERIRMFPTSQTRRQILDRTRLRRPLPIFPPLNMEFMRLGRNARRWTQRTRREEHTKHRRMPSTARRITARILVQEPSRGEHEITLPITPREPFLPLHQPRMHRDDAGILLGGVKNMFRVPKGRLRVQQMIAPRRKTDPLPIRSEGSHMLTKSSPRILDARTHPRLPFVKGLPGRLDSAHNAFFEMGRVLLHDDDGFLEGIFFVDLFCQLARDGGVGYEAVKIIRGWIGLRREESLRIRFGGDAHRGILEHRDIRRKITNKLGREFSFSRYTRGELSSIILYILPTKVSYGCNSYLRGHTLICALISDLSF